MAALDYLRLRESLPRARLLFVAHREEILTQSRGTFRQALRDPTFGELWVGTYRPRQFEHVFASIQSLTTTGLAHLDPAHFDVVVMDEFHHAAARTYRTMLDHLRPIELLGLTATPERSDGLPILDWFDGRIAAELRLWDAIDQQRLVAFALLRHPRWAGSARDPLASRRRVRRRGFVEPFDRKRCSGKPCLEGTRPTRRSCLRASERSGFCVSVEHARFMARVFREAGVPAVAIWSDTPDAERRAALTDLAARRVNVVFSVDLFNEGVDVPAVDTLLMLRPTDSPTLFLQQLGRGLRRSSGKTVVPSWILSAIIARSSASTGVSEPFSAARARTSLPRLRRASRSYRLAVTWNSIPSRQRLSCAASVKRFHRCGVSAVRSWVHSAT